MKRPDDEEETDDLEMDVEPDGPAAADLSDDDARVGGAAEKRATSALARSSSSLANRDPLAVYMREATRYELLTREQEHELAVRYVEDGDLDAARRLVTANLRLVVKIAYDYRQAYKNLLDLVQEGNIGLMQAVKKYDPYRGVKLSSYAAWWIRAYMLRYILANHRLVKLGTTQAQRKLFFNLQKEKSRLSAMGIDPTHEAIAERLAVPVKDVVSMDRRLARGDASLDAPIGGADGNLTTRMELMPARGQRMDDVLAETEVGDILKDKIHEYGDKLKGREKVIFDDRLMAEEPKTLQELGDVFGVSRERVRQVERRLLDKMKSYLRDEIGEVVDVYEA